MSYPSPNNFSNSQEHPSAVTILVLGILGVTCCTLTAPFAVFMGGKAKKEIDNGQYAPTTMVTIGYILGWIGCALLVLGIFAWIAVFALGFSGAGDVSSTNPYLISNV